ncbi:MAG: RidA family protein [Pararhodobacter sp.]|nr:RidA family protein [Pararhodobacter sp.]
MKAIGPTLPVPLSPGIVAGDTVYLSGQIPIAADGTIPEGIEAQTALVLDQIEALLAEAGSAMDRVVKCTVFLTDKANFAGFNGVYAARFPGVKPARSTVICDLVVPVLVEIEAIALRNPQG